MGMKGRWIIGGCKPNNKMMKESNSYEDNKHYSPVGDTIADLATLALPPFPWDTTLFGLFVYQFNNKMNEKKTYQNKSVLKEPIIFNSKSSSHSLKDKFPVCVHQCPSNNCCFFKMSCTCSLI